MTAPRPICRWCGHPITGAPYLWDGRPQCRDAIACNRRIPRTPQKGRRDR